MKQKTSEAKKTLETWKESYFDVRAKIEASGRDARWEFDRKRLFERTDHMASICEDLKEVATVMEEFYNIFGPELKAVTGDPKRIEDVLKRVDGLVKPIENVSSECTCWYINFIQYLRQKFSLQSSKFLAFSSISPHLYAKTFKVWLCDL